MGLPALPEDETNIIFPNPQSAASRASTIDNRDILAQYENDVNRFGWHPSSLPGKNPNQHYDYDRVSEIPGDATSIRWQGHGKMNTTTMRRQNNIHCNGGSANDVQYYPTSYHPRGYYDTTNTEARTTVNSSQSTTETKRIRTTRKNNDKTTADDLVLKNLTKSFDGLTKSFDSLMDRYHLKDTLPEEGGSSSSTSSSSLSMWCNGIVHSLGCGKYYATMIRNKSNNNNNESIEKEDGMVVVSSNGKMSTSHSHNFIQEEQRNDAPPLIRRRTDHFLDELRQSQI